MFSVVQNGQFLNQPRYFSANCGARFDTYVKRVRSSDFPYCQYNGGFTTHTDLWAGRTLKLKLTAAAKEWRLARVKAFDESLCGPFARDADWAMTVEFTGSNLDFQVGDVVEMCGLKGAQEHNGQVGSITKIVEQSGRFAVIYIEDQPSRKEHCVAVKPANIKHVKELKLRLHRCNLEGGGVLLAKRHLGLDPKVPISFEWLEEAAPKLELGCDYWVASCPTCRKKTDKTEFQADEETDTVECPVCLEMKDCNLLPACKHPICSKCLATWKKKQDGTAFFMVKDIMHTPGFQAPALEGVRETITGLSDEALQTAMERFAKDASDNNQDALIKYNLFLFSAPMMLWAHPMILEGVCEDLGIHAHEVLIRTLEEIHSTESDKYKNFVKEVIASLEGPGAANFDRETLADPAVVLRTLMSQLSDWLGLKYENASDYQSAIGWYEKALAYLPGDDPQQKAFHLNSLALALKRNGQFESAIKTYMECVALHPSNRGYTSNLQSANQELKQWMGTSGVVTPRLDN